MCDHCGLDETRRSNGLCDACNVYEHKYGQRPGRATLARRLRRRVMAELEREAWGA